MSGTPIPDPYEPDWIDGPPAEDSAYLLELARRYREQELRPQQEREIVETHRELVRIGEKIRALELASISAVLGAAAGGEDVREEVERLLALEGGSHALANIATRLIRVLGREHADEIDEFLDRARRRAEGEV